jgi:hypothetical protein
MVASSQLLFRRSVGDVFVPAEEEVGKDVKRYSSCKNIIVVGKEKIFF